MKSTTSKCRPLLVARAGTRGDEVAPGDYAFESADAFSVQIELPYRERRMSLAPRINCPTTFMTVDSGSRRHLTTPTRRG